MRKGVVTALVALFAVAPAQAAPDPLRDKQWGLDAVEADSAHVIARGGGAVVAVIDSGVDYVHPDLAGVLLSGYDFVEHDDDPYDQNGHGTHVVGILVAGTGNGLGVSSVAPEAKVLPLRALNADNEGASSNLTAAIDMAVERGAHVINLSVGESEHDTSVDFAIRRAAARDVVVVVAGDNLGDSGCSARPRVRGVLCVASVDRTRRRSPFSAIGTGVDISAPGGLGGRIRGTDILSTSKSGGYKEMAGTSQAAAYVSGVAALLVGRGLRGADVTRRLISTAADLGPPGLDDEYGAGLVNARTAVDPAGATLAAPGLSAPPSVTVASLRRHGLRVGCAAPRNGYCRIRLIARGRSVGRGSAKVTAGQGSVTTLRLTSVGKRTLHKPVQLVLRAALPGIDRTVRQTISAR